MRPPGLESGIEPVNSWSELAYVVSTGKMKCPCLDAMLLRANQDVHFRGRIVQAS